MSATMYPTTDYPTYTEPYESIEDLIADVEKTSEGLNFIVSWFLHDKESEDWCQGDRPEVDVLIFMPRLSKTTQFCYSGPFYRAAVQEWLDGYVKERTMRWFGWAA